MFVVQIWATGTDKLRAIVGPFESQEMARSYVTLRAARELPEDRQENRTYIVSGLRKPDW
jgi:hypothetical protein